jgi:hypothetical protein
VKDPHAGFFTDMLAQNVLFFLVHLAPRHPGLQHADLVDIVGWHGEQVVVNHDEVSPLAHFERTDRVFLMPGVGRIQREAAECAFAATAAALPSTMILPLSSNASEVNCTSSFLLLSV